MRAGKFYFGSFIELEPKLLWCKEENVVVIIF